jgi:hypothetical protein
MRQWYAFVGRASYRGTHELENEFVILNQVPRGAVVQAIPASRVAPLMVDENGLLVPGS